MSSTEGNKVDGGKVRDGRAVLSLERGIGCNTIGEVTGRGTGGGKGMVGIESASNTRGSDSVGKLVDVSKVGKFVDKPIVGNVVESSMMGDSVGFIVVVVAVGKGVVGPAAGSLMTSGGRGDAVKLSSANFRPASTSHASVGSWPRSRRQRPYGSTGGSPQASRTLSSSILH